MNITLLIIIVFIFNGICIAYILAFRKNVYEILQKEHVGASKSVDSIKDFWKIYLIIKENNNISKRERQMLRQHLIFTTISFFLFCVFVYLIYFTSW